ncbi:PEP-CTERM sorting domain-containing protein [Ancylothrix sp. C2]|uniref:PEP-CTERM sorting domain-containing protein n=1 Tax=Ancylothrix sp. D3o TaxID=2953691 RepID=UPI0021BA5B85|nr:PEP-CTERM sorting domain-containing protein [Ancylothrix sp. D3o]MCT7950351.1 PEP-CTERM sorting domain-containing protein [Ancylothrix sp. D3o]
MKLQLVTTISAAAATALLGFSGTAQAATFGNSGITFNSNTTVNFNFIRSQGAYQSRLGIYEVLTQGRQTVTSLVSNLFSEVKPSDNGRANEWAGTLGNTVLGSGKASFEFVAGRVYTLGLASTFNGNNRPTVFSTTSLNRFGGVNTQQAVFATSLPLNNNSTAALAGAANYNSANPFTQGGIQIGFDDRGNGNDADFQDFQVTAEAVPEPTTMAGMALGAAGLAYARRRRESKNESKN